MPGPSNDIAIKAAGLGKRYRLGAYHADGDSIRDAVQGFVRRLTQKEDKSKTEFWALRDASFEIRRGENVGIIGLNGAGKSTLLKILSQIVTPTEGSAEITGRLGALLEVGTGFHRELTGRENVYLYGSILGMSREEVEAKFDQIIEFSEIGRFIDTPVKRYSSGMYVRLAFAVAAHLDPDILLLDEVLAVGDFAFQRKCLEFARSLEKKGSTILFVSHNMHSIKAMCPRVIYLKKGCVVFDGPTEEGLALYENDSKLSQPHWYRPDEPTGFEITDIAVTNQRDEQTPVFDLGDRIRFKVSYKTTEPFKRPDFRFGFDRGSDGIIACVYSSKDDGVEVPLAEGEGSFEMVTPPLKLTADSYTVNCVIRSATSQIIAAKVAGVFHVRHPTISSDGSGVFHESGEWSFATAAKLQGERAEKALDIKVGETSEVRAD